MTQQTQAITQEGKGTTEFIPHGSGDRIKLSISIVQNMIASRTRTGKTCSEWDALRFIAMCAAKRLNPFEGDAYLVGYDTKDGPRFSLITGHQTYLKRAELHVEFNGMTSGVIIEEDGEVRDIEGDFHLPTQKVVGGWATVFFKNRKMPMRRRVRLARFAKDNAFWNDDPAGMIVKCAESDALRSSFPTMLGGLYLREEVNVLGSNSQDAIGPTAERLVAIGNLPPEAGAKEPSESGDDGDLAPATAVAKVPSPQEMFRELCTEPGYTLGQTLYWGAETGNIPDASSIPDWDSFPTPVITRLMRSKAGLLKGLQAAKEQGIK